MSSPISFLKEARAELDNVIWPSKQKASRLTVLVILASVLMSLYISSLDLLFTQLTKLSFILR
jgi:preprotein translocase SecE subunit